MVVESCGWMMMAVAASTVATMAVGTLISAVNAGGVGIFLPLPPLPSITVGKSKEQKQTGPQSTSTTNHQSPPPPPRGENDGERRRGRERERGGGERRRGEARKGRRSLRPPRPAHRNLCQWMLLLPRLAGLIRRGRAENAKNSY